MILSKANLLIAGITEKSGDNRLNTVHVAKDGTTVAANPRILIAVSPVKRKVKKNLTFLNDVGENISGTITAETAKSVLKYMPKDSLYKGLLEHCTFNDGKFEIHDGRRMQRVEGKLFEREYIDYKKAFDLIGKEEVSNEITINLKTLLQTLQTLDKVSQNSTKDSPVYITITENGHLLMRTENFRTGQRVMAFTTAYTKEENQWLTLNIWESRLLGLIKKLGARLKKKRK